MHSQHKRIPLHSCCDFLHHSSSSAVVYKIKQKDHSVAWLKWIWSLLLTQAQAVILPAPLAPNNWLCFQWTNYCTWAPFWVVGNLTLTTITLIVSYKAMNCIDALTEPFNAYWRLFDLFPSCPTRLRGSFKKNCTSVSTISIAYNSVIDFLSLVPLLFCIVLHSVDPNANLSSLVVRRAMCSPPDPERRLPGHHSRTAQGSAVPADYQLLRQGQGKRDTYWRVRTRGRVVEIMINPWLWGHYF